jgi:hypothetical protein
MNTKKYRREVERHGRTSEKLATPRKLQIVKKQKARGSQCFHEIFMKAIAISKTSEDTLERSN